MLYSDRYRFVMVCQLTHQLCQVLGYDKTITKTNDSNGDDGSGCHNPSENFSPSNDNGRLICFKKKKCFCSFFYLKFSQIVLILKKGKSTANKHQSERSDEISMLPSSLIEEDNIKSIWDKQTGNAVLPNSNSYQTKSFINWNSRLDRRLKLGKNALHSQRKSHFWLFWIP